MGERIFFILFYFIFSVDLILDINLNDFISISSDFYSLFSILHFPFSFFLFPH